VPFRVGEEVHVDIVEPHMYNPDDGVAKIDGYLIAVTGGIGFVGEKKLVRIEEAGRTAALASLTGSDLEIAEEAAKERAAERMRVEERARRSAAAKRGAASRKAREEEDTKKAAKPKAKPAKRRAKAEPKEAPKPRGRRRSRARPEDDGAVEADAVQALTDEEAPEAGTAPAAVDEASENGDALSSRPRRRGRRGGRRRSRAKASADADE
jgi:ribonuclease G